MSPNILLILETAMEQSQFHQFAEALMQQIEAFIDKYVMETDLDVDYELQGNVMKITLPSKTKIIINTQTSLSQIWMATQYQGYHFRYNNGAWYCIRSQQEFMEIFNKALKHEA